MNRVGIALVFAAIGACGAACSAGQSLGENGGTGAANATGGSSGTIGSGGSGAAHAGGSSGTNGSSGSNATGGSSGTNGGGSNATGGSSGTAGSSGSSTGGGMTTACPSAVTGSSVLRLLTRREIENTLNDIFPSVKGQWTDTLPANPTTDSGFDNDAGAIVGNQLASALYDTALSVGAAVTGSNFQNAVPCPANTKPDVCAQTFLDTTGKALFRRQLSSDESMRYLALFDQALAATDFPTAMKWVIAALIQSPNAVYRNEVSGTLPDGSSGLNGDQIATELAYTYGGSTPTAKMLGDFESTSPPDRVATALSLLQTDNGKLTFQHFFEQYLTYVGTTAVSRTLTNPAPQQGFDYTDVSSDMLTETRSFIDNVLFKGDGSLKDLLTSNKTYPSSKLATYYGFGAPGSDGSVTRPAGQGLGVLAQGSFLSTHANPDYSSPTQRGLFVFYRLLCQPKQSPPGGNAPPFTQSETSAATTTRELYEVSHMTANNCKSCHVQFDPLGFGFEQFDQGGRFRTQQNGQNVDPSGNAMLADGTMLFSFANEEDLVQQLAASPEVAECFSNYLATYAFGTSAACLGLDQGDTQHVLDGSLKVVEAFANIAGKPNFTKRSAQ